MLLVAAAIGPLKWWGAGTRKQPFVRKQITRFSVPTEPEGGALSPDGKCVVYLALENDGRSLWIKQVNGGGSARIADLGSNKFVWSLAVSPDSNFVYYVLNEPQGPVLYRVPLLGGQPPRQLPAKITIFANENFSPDGQRVAVGKPLPGTGGMALKLVTLASGAEQVLATWPDATVEGRAWSPDDRTVAYVVHKLNDPGGKNFYLAERPVGGGPEHIIIPAQTQPLRKVLWLPQRRGLLVEMRSETSGSYQVYVASYADGTLRPLTEDTDEYYANGLTTDGRTLLMSRLDRLGSIQVAPLAAPRRAQPLIPGLNFFDTLAWTPDGQVLYNQLAESGNNLWRLTPGLGTTQQLTTATGANYYPCATADGRYIVFTSTQAGGEQLWRINADGGHPLQLTTQGGTRPQCAPDSQWIVYENGRSPHPYGRLLSTAARPRH